MGNRILSAVVCISVPDGHCHSRRRRDTPCYHSTIATASFAIAVPFTIFHTWFIFGIQFVATGADRLGECTGLVQAAASSNEIPESKVSQVTRL